MLGSQNIVNTRDWRIVGSCLHHIWVFLGFLCNLSHHVDEAVDSLFALILCGLNHHSLMEEEWEVDSGSVVSIIKQTLGHIHRGNIGRFVLESVEYEFVLAESLNG